MKSPAERNLELTLEQVRAQIVTASAELSEILQKHHEEAQRGGQELLTLQTQIKETRNEFDACKEREKRKQQELRVLRQQCGEAMTELAKLNSWIATADEVYATKCAQIPELEKIIAEKEEIAKAIIALKDEQSVQQKQLDTFRLGMTLERDDAKALRDKLLKEAAKADRRRIDAEAAASAALNSRDAMIHEKERIKADLEIYIQRIEARYQEAFPGLRMIL